MTTLILRDLDDELMARLRARAAGHARSVDDEARSIVEAALCLNHEPGSGAALVAHIRAMVEPFGGIELELSPRTPMREPPDFSSGEFKS